MFTVHTVHTTCCGAQPKYGARVVFPGCLDQDSHHHHTAAQDEMDETGH